MKFYLYNEKTCIRLKLFGEEIRSLLKNNGWKESDSASADYLFINSCSFLESKEREFLKIIEEKNMNTEENQKICVFGCLPSTHAQKIKKISEDILLFRRDLGEISKFLNLSENKADFACLTKKKLSPLQSLSCLANRIFIKDSGIEYRLNKKEVFHLKISDGCLGKCSYCSERFTSRLKSHKIEEITDKFKEGIEKGYKIFSLNSDDSSVFGRDNGENIYDLLGRLTGYEEDFKLAITEFNPGGLFDNRVQNLLSSEKIIFVTVPIQSGSQRILNKMRRQYSIRKVVKIISKIKKSNPNVKINTHIIVGFPGETIHDFQKTLNVLDKGIFDRVKIFAYNDRPNTEASFMRNKIPEDEKKRRANIVKTKIIINSLKSLSLSNLILNTMGAIEDAQ